MNKENALLEYIDAEQPEYEERADYLTEEQLNSWTASSEHFENVQKKLLQVGAKLIVGPRGTGKTHQMKCAYFACQEDPLKPLALYITFNHYLRLESFLHKESNAISIFHAWVLSKIAIECIKSYGVTFDEACLSKENIIAFIHDAERNLCNDRYTDVISSINIHKVQDLIDSAIKLNNRKRAILLLDDAALTLTHDYMVEFFDIFRSIKSIRISPKASVYPGTTKYGPRFHVGQDAEKISIWMNVEDNDYIDFMSSIVDQRFSGEIQIEKEIKELLMFSAFGIPRTYIMLLRSYSESKKRSSQQKFNSIIQEKCENIESEYFSIADKIPQYRKIIEIGYKFLKSTIDSLREKNHIDMVKNGEDYKKTITIGIEDIDDKAERMIKFLIEAGLLYEQGIVSHGTDRKLRRFTPHLAFLIKDRIFIKNTSAGYKHTLNVLTSPSMKHPLRRKFDKVISQESIDNITLDLPPCSACGAMRITDGQKYCHICGKPLVDGSIFYACMKKSLNELPLTIFQKKVVSVSNLNTIEDVITSDDLAAKLMSTHGVGPKYSEKIEKKITTWINEFLY